MENEDYSFEHAETRYKIETADRRELSLYLNATKMLCALYDVLELRHRIYNGKDYGCAHIMYKGKLYTESEFERDRNNIVLPEDRDEIGFIKSGLYSRVYTEEDILRELNNCVDDISEFVYKYME